MMLANVECSFPVSVNLSSPPATGQIDPDCSWHKTGHCGTLKVGKLELDTRLIGVRPIEEKNTRGHYRERRVRSRKLMATCLLTWVVL